MEGIKQFIITIVTALILMTAVEIISPDKPIKKYIKFVLGVIFIAVMINPIIHFATHGESEIIGIIKSYENDINNDVFNKSNEESNKAREEAFKENLDKNCEQKLKENFGDMEFEADIACSFDFEDMTYVIDEVQVGVKDKGVKLVEKIKISIKGEDTKEAMSTQEDIQNQEEIIACLVQILGVSKDKIKLYSI